MVELKNKQILIDGKPEMILAGEIHYFRLARSEWQDRIDKLKAAGFNTVATYIPWICHEPEEGCFDLDGHSRPELDIAAFIELCAQNDLHFIARPGPFIMAEMKNEGIPHWVAAKYPELRSVTWDGRAAGNSTLDYMNPHFLDCAKKWYGQIMPILRDHLQTKGGNIIGVQLDNEIGMISWCSNAPDLTDVMLADFKDYLGKAYDEKTFGEKYPFDRNNAERFAAGVRCPKEDYVLTLKKDLGNYMRFRFKNYVLTLTEYAEECGVTGVPYLINIHGTSDGRGLTYMIGISQLYEAYTSSDKYFSGSDIYLGALTMENFQDLYLLNGYMEAVNRENQPLASFEFECGDANYCEVVAARSDVSAVDFKARMCVAQGNKALNCYLFCGGRNYEIEGLKDGNGRIAITGERHGFAAPVNPEGELNYTYDRMAQVMTLMNTNGDKLANMQEERDDVAMGFIPDYYMTEYHYPGSEKETALQENLVRYRGRDGIERFARTMLLNNFRFSSVNIQDNEFSPQTVKTLVVFSASYMASGVQKKLVDYVSEGGGLILYGVLPVMDMEGNPCTLLKDALAIGEIHMYQSSGTYYLSVQPAGYIGASAEVTAGYAQTYEVNDVQPLLVTADKGEISAFEKSVGKGRIIVIGTPYICHLDNQKKMFDSLGCRPGLTQNAKHHGIFMTMMKNDRSERYLHVFNIDGFEKRAQITYNDRLLFDGRELRIGSREGLMLPLDMEIDGKKVIYSTAEIMERSEKSWTLRLTQEEDRIVFEGVGFVKESEGYDLCEKDGRTIVTSRVNGKLDPTLKLRYK